MVNDPNDNDADKWLMNDPHTHVFEDCFGTRRGLTLIDCLYIILEGEWKAHAYLRASKERSEYHVVWKTLSYLEDKQWKL